MDMSKIDQTEVERLAALARIGLKPAEVKSLATELAQIVAFVKQLQQADTAGLAPTHQVTGLTDVWRDDVVRAADQSPAELLKNAPQTVDGYIKVRRVIE